MKGTLYMFFMAWVISFLLHFYFDGVSVQNAVGVGLANSVAICAGAWLGIALFSK
jgi:hypothetical protein